MLSIPIFSEKLNNINDTQKSQGRLGVALALSSGQKFAVGIREIIMAAFTFAQNTSATSTMIDFGDQVIRREIIDVSANLLTATWTSGKVNLSCGVEADVTPRSTSDGRVSIADWVQVGRFAAALDVAVNGCEFQKADCAAKPCGEGRIGIADWVQAGRYAAGLDPLVPACGPTSPASANMTNTVSKVNDATARTVRVINKIFYRGQTDSLTIELEAQGDENALGFSLNFDPAVMMFVQAQSGSGATNATLNVNNTQTANGRLGIALALPSGQKFVAGARSIVNVIFFVNRNTPPTSTTVDFGDQPIAREIVDASANALSSIWTSGTITIQILTSLNEKANGAPTSFALEQNHPNPFNPSTTIAFSLPRAEHVTLKIFDLVGREIVTLIDKKLVAGRYEVRWDASGIQSGIFFYQLRAGEFVATRKLVLMQ